MELHQERAASPSFMRRSPEIDKKLAKATTWPTTRESPVALPPGFPPPPSPKELSIMRFNLKAVDRPQDSNRDDQAGREESMELHQERAAGPSFMRLPMIDKKLAKASTWPTTRDIAAAFPPPSLKDLCTTRFKLKALSFDYLAFVECSDHATDAGQVGEERVKRESGRTRQRRATAI